jgi:hypothetical protein
MEHWRGIGIPIHDCNYARLLDDPRGETARMLEFLDLPWQDACLNFHDSPGPVVTASLWQVRQPLFKSSLGRWRHYERHLGPLVEALERADVELQN